MSRKAFIIGGTGQIGRAVALKLLDDGWQVHLTSRGRRPLPEDLRARGAKLLTVDRETPGALAAALGDGADAVIDTVAYDAHHADPLLALQDDIGTFMIVSSSSVYSDDEGRTLDEACEKGFPQFPVPIPETQSTVAPGPETYSTRKAALEHRWLEKTRKPVTLLRPGAVHGPWSTHPREWWFVKRMRDGRAFIPLAYGGESRFHTSAVANIASLIATTLDSTATRVLNVADPEAPTVAEIGEWIARLAGYQGEIRRLDTDPNLYPAPVGGSPWSLPSPFVLDISNARATGWQPVTDYAGALPETIDWLMRQPLDQWQERFPVLAAYPGNLFDYQLEDKTQGL